MNEITTIKLVRVADFMGEPHYALEIAGSSVKGSWSREQALEEAKQLAEQMAARGVTCQVEE